MTRWSQVKGRFVLWCCKLFIITKRNIVFRGIGILSKLQVIGFGASLFCLNIFYSTRFTGVVANLSRRNTPFQWFQFVRCQFQKIQPVNTIIISEEARPVRLPNWLKLSLELLLILKHQSLWLHQSWILVPHFFKMGNKWNLWSLCTINWQTCNCYSQLMFVCQIGPQCKLWIDILSNKMI